MNGRSGAHGWGISLVLHGLAVGGMLALAGPEVTPPMRWEVSMVVPVPESVPAQQPRALSRAEPVVPPQSALVAAPPTPPQSLPEPGTQASADQAPAAPPAPHPVMARVAEVAVPMAAVAMPVPEAPPPRVAGTPQPAQDNEAQKRWYAGLRAKLAELKQYPLVARRLGQEGVVVLEALVQPDGRAEVTLKRGCGHAALDRAAVRLFEEAAAAMRTAMAPDQTSHLEIPVAYRLQE